MTDELLFRVLDAIEEIGRERGKSIPQIAINWLLQSSAVSSVIIGARDETQLRENLGSVGWNLTADQVARLDTASMTALPYPCWHQSQFTERNPSPTRAQRMCFRNLCVRSSFGEVNIVSGGPRSMISPLSMKTTECAAARANPIS